MACIWLDCKDRALHPMIQPQADTLNVLMVAKASFLEAASSVARPSSRMFHPAPSTCQLANLLPQAGTRLRQGRLMCARVQRHMAESALWRHHRLGRHGPRMSTRMCNVMQRLDADSVDFLEKDGKTWINVTAGLYKLPFLWQNVSVRCTDAVSVSLTICSL